MALEKTVTTPYGFTAPKPGIADAYVLTAAGIAVAVFMEIWK